MPTTTLSIIIISFNTKDLLQQTIDSISLKPDWEIIVVDNASTDGSVELVKTKYPHLQLIENNSNRGFAAANNQALEIAQGEYCLLLNSDTQVVDSALDQLVSYLNNHTNVGMITPRVVLPDGAIDLACHRGEPTPWRAFTYFAKLEQLFPNSKLFGGYHQTQLDFNTTHEVEATAGTAMMVRRQAVHQVGLLDERFFFYAEDLDWCKRFREAGWKIVYHSNAVVLHHKSASGKKHKTDKLKAATAKAHFWDTMKQYYEKHYDKKYPWLLKKIIYGTIELKRKLA